MLETLLRSAFNTSGLIESLASWSGIRKSIECIQSEKQKLTLIVENFIEPLLISA